jgi:chromosome segregation ATPase
MDEQRPDLAPADPIHTVPTFDIVRRGFNQEQVLGHLKLVGERVSDLESRLDPLAQGLQQARTDLERARFDLEQARREIEKLQRERDSVSTADRDPYKGVSEHVMELVRGFDGDVERFRRRAELEATRIMAEVRTEAAKKRMEALAAEEEARAHVERLLADAQDEAASVRAELAPLREWTLSQAQAIRDRMRMSLLELETVMPRESDQEPVIVVGEARERHLEESQKEQLLPGDGPGTRRGE